MFIKPARNRKKLKKQKRTSIKSKKISKIHKILGLSLLFLSSLGLLFGFFIYQNISKKLASAMSINSPLYIQRSNIEDKNLITLMYVSTDDLSAYPILANSIYIVFIDKLNKKMVVHKIDPDAKMEIPGKFGSEQFSKILAIGDLNSDDSIYGGIDLMQKSLSNLFGYRIDRFVLVDGSLENSFNKFFTTGVLDLPLGLSTIKKIENSLITNLSLTEMYAVYSFAESLPSDRFIVENLTQSYYDNPSLLDEEIRDITFDSKLSGEKKSIAVLNGSGTPGVANYASRVISNMGGRVIAVENALQMYDKSVLVADDISSDTVKEIKEFFGFKNVVGKNDFGGTNDNAIDRADITLIIGIDIAKGL